jgi:hypothetical protein
MGLLSPSPLLQRIQRRRGRALQPIGVQRFNARNFVSGNSNPGPPEARLSVICDLLNVPIHLLNEFPSKKKPAGKGGLRGTNGEIGSDSHLRRPAKQQDKIGVKGRLFRFHSYALTCGQVGKPARERKTESDEKRWKDALSGVCPTSNVRSIR